MIRTRVRRRRVALVVVLALAGGLTAARLTQADGPRIRPVASHRYVVRDGDTLWSIASRLQGGGIDPRPLMDAIESANHVDPGALHPGQTLVIPSA